MRRQRPLLALTALFLLADCSLKAHAVEVQVSANALERTLRTQLFNAPDGRYYLRGNARTPCSVYAEDPHVTFQAERIVIHVHTHARLGTVVRGACLGMSLATVADVSVIPQAEEQSIGFRDARIETLSESKELNFLLIPFLSRKLPTEMKLDAASLIRDLLARSVDVTGYAVDLETLKLHSLAIEGQLLNLDLDARFHIN